MLLRQSPAQSRQPCGPAFSPRIGRAPSDLETLTQPRLSPLPHASLTDMYPEESRGSGGAATVDFLEGTYDYAAPTPAQTPLYSHSTSGYYSAPLDAQGPPSDGSRQSLGSGPASPHVYVPSSPRLSPFMHPPSHHYLETTAPSVYRWGNTHFLYPWSVKSESTGMNLSKKWIFLLLASKPCAVTCRTLNTLREKSPPGFVFVLLGFYNWYEQCSQNIKRLFRCVFIVVQHNYLSLFFYQCKLNHCDPWGK